MFRKFACESLGDESFALERITRDHVEAYQRARMADGASPATVNAHIRHLRAFLRWCEGEGWIPSDPTRGIRMLKVVKRDKGKILVDSLPVWVGP
jgi:site-specific recombinase XerD